MKKLLSNLLVFVSVVFLLWCGISYGEILLKHGGPNPEYSDKNIIVNMVEWANEYYGYEN